MTLKEIREAILSSTDPAEIESLGILAGEKEHEPDEDDGPIDEAAAARVQAWIKAKTMQNVLAKWKFPK